MSKLFGLVFCDTVFIVLSIKSISFRTKYYIKDSFCIVFCKLVLIFVEHCFFYRYKSIFHLLLLYFKDKHTNIVKLAKKLMDEMKSSGDEKHIMQATINGEN